MSFFSICCGGGSGEARKPRGFEVRVSSVSFNDEAFLL
jgi:hypothetical protein